MPQIPASTLIQSGLLIAAVQAALAPPVASALESSDARASPGRGEQSLCPVGAARRSAAFSCGYPSARGVAHATGGSDYRVRITGEHRFFLLTGRVASSRLSAS